MWTVCGLSHLSDLTFCKKTLDEMSHMSRPIVRMNLPITSCPWLRPLSHPSSFHRGMFKLNAKCDADLLLYLLSHFECAGHTVHLLTQHLLPPVTSTVKSSLFMHVHSSPLSLAVRLHWGCATFLVIWTTARPFLDRPSYINSFKPLTSLVR